MAIEDLHALRPDYAHVYLSPHLDDAALCCGGMIAAQVAAGEPTLVVTCCTAAPPPEGPFNALALAFHQEWGLPPGEVVAARLREDRAALAVLGTDSLWAGMLDAIYRHPAAYTAREQLFGAPAPDDPLLPALRAYLKQLRERLPGAQFYAPLGVGLHADHLITHEAAAFIPGLRYYEDFPYVARPGTLEQRLGQIAVPLTPRRLAIDATLERKVAAVLVYTSQLPELAHSQLGRQIPPDEAPALFAEAVASYARTVAPPGAMYGERVWVAG